MSASAGWGKTTLLSGWARSREREPVAWLTLGPEDDDRRRLLTGLTASIARLHPELSSLDVPPTGSTDEFLAALLSAAAGAGGLTVVLDGLEHVRSADALGDIGRIASLGDPAIRVVVSARSDPSLGLQRRRLAGDLVEVRARDLAFGHDEVERLLTAADVAVAPENRALLLERTEGWPAALALATLALRGHSDPDEFVRTFSGNDRAISDYLTAEVLGGLDPETAEFLVATSSVDAVSEDLAAAILGNPAAGRPLGELAHSEGILSRADEHGRWYRCHPLLAAVLRAELRRRPRDEVAGIHSRAAGWYADAGMVPEALAHAVAAQAWGTVADLLGDQWLPAVVRGQGGILRTAMSKVPAAVFWDDAEIALAAAGLALDAGDSDAGARRLDRAVELAGRLPDDRRERFERTLSALLVSRSRDVEELRELLAEPGAGMDDEIRALALTNLGAQAFWLGRAELATRSLEEAAGLAGEHGNDFVLVAAHGWLAAVYQLAGRTREAATLASRSVALATARGWGENPQVAIAFVVQAVQLTATNQPDEAAGRIDRARLAVSASDGQLRMAIAGCRARLLAMGGEPLAALEVLRAAGAGRNVYGWQAEYAVRFECELLVQAGQVSRARSELEAAAAGMPAPALAVSWAKIALAEGDAEAAAAVVGDDWLAHDHPAELRAEGLALRAVALDALGDPRAADAALTRALDEAEPPGYRSMLRRLGGSMAELLRRHARHGGAHAAFAEELVGTDVPGRAETERADVLVEALSERELAVLRFLPTMLSNAEIASELFVSVNTVKTHLRHIYRKLDVADRRQAVRRGRQLHLLNPGLGGR